MAKKIGFVSNYASLALRERIEEFIFMPYKLFLTFPFIKRFGLNSLPLSGGKTFAPDETLVRLVADNDSLQFCLMVNHEGHDYTLTHPHHLEWARALLADLGIEGYNIEMGADIFLASSEDFERLYDFLSLHAIRTSYH